MIKIESRLHSVDIIAYHACKFFVCWAIYFKSVESFVFLGSLLLFIYFKHIAQFCKSNLLSQIILCRCNFVMYLKIRYCNADLNKQKSWSRNSIIGTIFKVNFEFQNILQIFSCNCKSLHSLVAILFWKIIFRAHYFEKGHSRAPC